MSACKNHICDSSAAAELRVACPLCLEAKYCSEQCRTIDWIAHVADACPNAHFVADTQSTTLFKPYYYEDDAPVELVQSEPVDSPIFASHLMFQHGADQKMAQIIQGPLVGDNTVLAVFEQKQPQQKRGSEPKFSGSYVIQIDVPGTGQSIRVHGEIPKDMIFKDNKNNRKASELAGFGGGLWGRVRNAGARFNKATGSLIFWPGTSNVLQAKRQSQVTNKQGFNIPLRGMLKVQLITAVSGVKTSTVEVMGNYNIEPARSGVARFGKSFSKWFQGRLKTKFGDKDDGIKYMYPLVAEANGLVVIPIFQVLEGSNKAQLVDVEVMVPEFMLYEGTNFEFSEKQHIASSEYSFSCDPRSLEQVQGLTMALERDALIGEGHSEHLQHVAGIIRKHTRTLLEKGGSMSEDDAVPAEVNTAIHTAVAALHDQYMPVELTPADWFRNRKARAQFLSKIKKYTTKPQFDAEFAIWLTQARELRAQNAVATTSIENARAVDLEARRKGFVVQGIDELNQLRQTQKQARRDKKVVA